jgi:hypothetical protein
MATLCLGEIDGSAPLLRDWLAGDWALLFSHPADFQDQGLERDRWLEILRDEFRVRGVRPVACSPSADAGATADDSWAGELIYDHRVLRLPSDAAGAQSAGGHPGAAAALRTDCRRVADAARRAEVQRRPQQRLSARSVGLDRCIPPQLNACACIVAQASDLAIGRRLEFDRAAQLRPEGAGPPGRLPWPQRR